MRSYVLSVIKAELSQPSCYRAGKKKELDKLKKHIQARKKLSYKQALLLAKCLNNNYEWI
jgi:hypothetical protein